MHAESGRIAYWDNLKAFLIFCVVLGHMILPGLSFNTYMNMKSCFYIVEAVLIFAICVICPSKKFRISYIGERTLPIYIGHRIIREFLAQCGFYKGIEWNNLMFSGFCLISSVFLVILFSAESFNRITRLPFHCFTRYK